MTEHNIVIQILEAMTKNSTPPSTIVDETNKEGWVLLDSSKNPDTGFEATAYKNLTTGRIVISYKGTDITQSKDWTNNLNIATGKPPQQYYDALKFYEKYQNLNPLVSGYSLGGGIAELVGAKTGAKTITINAPGMAHLLPSIGIEAPENLTSYSNITNYNLANDALHLLNIAYGLQQLGNTFILPSNGNSTINAHLDFESLKGTDFIPYYMWYFKNQDLCALLKRLEKSGAKEDISKLLEKIEYLASGYQQYGNLNLDDSKSNFNQAQSTQPIIYDPVLVDLNGDGVIGTTNIEDGINFDHQGDGFAEKSAWVDENDGILAIDKNGDGVINNGGEVFGDNYIKSNGSKATSGFDALKDLDSNNDGIISAEDEAFSQIKILKGDGTLLSLEEAGITSINLNSTAKNTVDENGNTLISQGTFTKADGTTGNLGDFNLVVDKMNSFATEWLDESEEIAALPEVLGSGTVYSLHQAMVRDESGVLKIA